MNNNILRPLKIIILCMIFSLQALMAHSGSMSMTDLMKLFKERTGKNWNDVTSKERTEFMHSLHGSKKKKARKERVEGEKTPYYIREGYARDFGKNWDLATIEEQEAYIKDYKIKKKEAEIREKERKKAAADRKKEVVRKQREQKRALMEKKRNRERKKMEKQKELRDKRKNEKNRIRDAKRKMQELKNRNSGRRQ